VTIRLRHHLQSLGDALRRLIRDPLGSALNALVIAWRSRCRLEHS
jgi:hypothetical protein